MPMVRRRRLLLPAPTWESTGPDIRNTPVDMQQWATNRGAFPDPKKAIPRSAQVPPFYQVRPPTGVDFFYKRTGTLAAGAGSTLVLAQASRPLLILSDYAGVVAGVTIFVDVPLATLDITFALRINGGTVQGWDKLEPFPTAANAIIIPFPGTLQIPGNSLLDVLVTNNAASGPWTVGASVAGWQWPRIDELIAFGLA